MKVVASFYLTITNGDEESYLENLKKASVIILFLSLSKSCQTYLSDMCSLKWRDNLVRFLHHHYFSCLSGQLVSDDGKCLEILEVIECNPEQRISQDVDKLTIEMAKVFVKIIFTPVLIIFYSCY